MFEFKLHMLQRVTALIMAPMILCHIGVMIYAVQGGLSVSEILGRTQGSVGWALFYGSFVLAVAVHATIGVRTILSEITPLNRRRLDTAMAILLLGLVFLGAQAVWAVTFA